jgi:hypothetical protein
MSKSVKRSVQEIPTYYNKISNSLLKRFSKIDSREWRRQTTFKYDSRKEQSGANWLEAKPQQQAAAVAAEKS